MGDSDVKDILGMARTPKKSSGRAASSRRTPTKAKRPDGMSREVFALTGGVSVPLAPTTSPMAKGLKEKRKTGKKVSWVWRPFTNSAREDGAVFYHWVKASDKEEDYYYARFNKKVPQYRYTPQEYDLYFKSDDWTKEETDMLLDLCERFDQRFIVIADRFPEFKKNDEKTEAAKQKTSEETNTGKEMEEEKEEEENENEEGRNASTRSTGRSVEDLKARYYTVQKKLVELRLAGKPELNEHPLLKLPYDKDHEVKRKQQYERLHARTKEQVAEEESLVEACKLIEKYRSKDAKVKEEVQKLANSVLLGIPLPSQKKSRRSSLGSTQRAGVSLASRSTNSLTVSTRTAHKVDLILKELDIEQQPLPTLSVCEAFNQLRQDIVVLIDLQKHMQRKEYEWRLLQEQKKQLSEQKQKVAAIAKEQLPPCEYAKLEAMLSAQQNGNGLHRQDKERGQQRRKRRVADGSPAPERSRKRQTKEDDHKGKAKAEQVDNDAIDDNKLQRKQEAMDEAEKSPRKDKEEEDANM